MKPLITTKEKTVLDRCVAALNKAGIAHTVKQDPDSVTYRDLISVDEKDYPKAMQTLYPNRNNPKIGSVVWP